MTDARQLGLEIFLGHEAYWGGVESGVEPIMETPAPVRDFNVIIYFHLFS